ncbi:MULTISPECIES: peptide chain release factor N(5)-glutamine methyltransferase [Segatella]|uniref:peptide chain release factor N(5)-glutamine methyltransferase n=2 Tax=Segatella TaxID=2974251 RepID=D8DXE3_9BACT|nr:MULTISPECIES: peptide chain release factor N(5)-glutamine methyltransferase [Segatella]EFI71907.1 modification methylase, HemK family [Segatella baroniae B14]UKK77972.1 peptide chain release factor N(5)-glutamine methyltransferase [Segatella baroniae B14]GJG27747.1 release factor glutamine methyltransferase [Segatella bryantii]SEP87274.1 release factor glutamine methyltransferase [Segatella baroniae B14]
MTYQQIWQRLTPLYEAGEARAITRLVLERLFNMSMTDIVIGKVSELSSEEENELEKNIQRIEKGEPVQYVLGIADFYGRTFHVEPGVLIPRPETAELLDYIPKVNQKQTILDIGTGSGCIAITASLEHTQAEVSAWDISPKALQIAKDNAQRLNATVDFHLQDALNAPDHQSCWDVILSNPPYIMDKERQNMEKNVLDYEPELALFVPDQDPLKFYTAIARYSVRALKPKGILLFEINPLCADAMLRMLQQEGLQQNELIQDQFGKYRFTKSIKE